MSTSQFEKCPACGEMRVPDGPCMHCHSHRERQAREWLHKRIWQPTTNSWCWKDHDNLTEEQCEQRMDLAQLLAAFASSLSPSDPQWEKIKACKREFDDEKSKAAPSVSGERRNIAAQLDEIVEDLEEIAANYGRQLQDEIIDDFADKLRERLVSGAREQAIEERQSVPQGMFEAADRAAQSLTTADCFGEPTEAQRLMAALKAALQWLASRGALAHRAPAEREGE